MLVADGVFNAQVAVDGGGGILLVWEQGPNPRNFYFGESVWARRFAPGSGWGPLEMLYDRGQPSPSGALSPRVAATASGSAIVAWSIEGEAVWTATFDPASGWSKPLRLAEAEYWSRLDPRVFPEYPVVAAGGVDAGFVAFTRIGCTRPATSTTCAVTSYATYASRWTLKDGFSSPQVALQAPLAHIEPALFAADGVGDAFVARVEYPSLSPPRAVVAVARFEANRGWLPSASLPVPDQASAFPNALVTHPTGDALLLWSLAEYGAQPGSEADTLWAASFRPSIGWGSSARVDSSGTVDVHQATGAWNRSGDAAVAWPQRSPSGLWTSRADSPGAWSTPQALQTGASADCPAVAANGQRGFVAAWRQTGAQAGSIWASRFTPRQGWGVPVLVASAGTVGCPLVAASPDGSVLLFWEQTSEPPSPAGSKGSQVYTSRMEGE